MNTLYDGNAALPPAPANAADFYGYSAVANAIDRRGPELWEQSGATAAERQQVRDAFIGIARTTALPEPLVATLAESHINNLLADARPVKNADAAQVLDQQIAGWNTEARAALRDTFGPNDVEQLLDRTRRFVRAHPALAKVLQQRGLGSRPDIVQGIAAHVFSTGWR